jgi:hypothetical protein
MADAFTTPANCAIRPLAAVTAADALAIELRMPAAVARMCAVVRRRLACAVFRLALNWPVSSVSRAVSSPTLIRRQPRLPL